MKEIRTKVDQSELITPALPTRCQDKPLMPLITAPSVSPSLKSFAENRATTSPETRDEFARATTRLIIRDEVMHGQFGVLYLDACGEYLSKNPDVTDSLAVYLVHAFAVLEQELASDKLRAMRCPSKEAMELGVIDPKRAIEVFYGTMEHVVVPALEQRGIAAEHAWKHRAFS